MTTTNTILRKLFIGSMMLVAMFALAGSVLFFTDTASAARGGDRTPPTAEELDQRVADGDLTQEEADRIAERAAEREALAGVIDRDAIKQAMADEMGITVEEMEAAKESGMTLQELAEANGTTAEAVHEAAQAEKEAQIQAALDSGEITEEQAERLRNGRNGRGGNGGGRRGPGNGQPPVESEA